MPRRRSSAPSLVTLSSDLGDAYAAQLKAVLAHRLPAGGWVDLAHDLRPHAIGEAGFLVRAMASRFPAGTVHVVVVDPGVGGRRAPVAVACRDGSVLVGPDNGVLAPLAESLGGGVAYRLDPGRLRAAPRVGTTFDGRDVFAPAAALLATGARPSELGPRTSLREAARTRPKRGRDGATGHVVHVDRFGNLISDVPSAWVPVRARALRLSLAGRSFEAPWVRSYEERGPDVLVVLGSSFGTVEVAVGEGSAAVRLGAEPGARLRLVWPGRTGSRARRNGKYRPT